MPRAALILSLAVGMVSLPSPAVTREPWLLWSRDTHFKDHQPARYWRTERWIVRGGPFDSRDDCNRRKDTDVNSAAQSLGDGYRITARLDASLVARQRDGAAGLRRRYVCLPVGIAPPR
jgi:hypothetical protein